MSVFDNDSIFAVIERNRSGQYAGEIDYTYRAVRVRGLTGSERQSMLNTAYDLYQAICRELDGKADSDKQ